MLYVIILIGVAVTSFISAVLGMAGGMILMGLYAWVLPVSAAMILHGVTQAASNGFRAYLLRDHINFDVLYVYVFGAALALGIFSIIEILPSKGVIFTLIGIFPVAALFLRNAPFLEIQRPSTAFASGIIVTAAQLLAGASGPVLDVFYVKSTMDKNAVIATKAVTQTLGHVLKILYYGLILGIAAEEGSLPIWIFPAVILTAMAGTRTGRVLFDRLSEGQFRTASRIAVVSIGVIYIFKGIQEFAAA